MVLMYRWTGKISDECIVYVGLYLEDTIFTPPLIVIAACA